MTAKPLVLIALLTVMLTPAAERRTARDAVRMPEDLVSIRQLADRGNIQAQLVLGRKLLANNQNADALAWYRKTAEKDCLDGVYQVGHLLLFGANSPHAGQSIAANPAEGIQWTYRAATNFYVGAYRNMSLAMQRGLGVRTNLAEAYAWMQLYADGEPENGRAALEMLGLKLKTDVLVEGRRLAGEFRKKQWPKLKSPATQVAKATPVLLKLTGITVGGRTPLAVINKRSFGPGESGKVTLAKGGTATLKCVEIREDAVLVEVEGEDDPRWLQFDNSVGGVAGP